MRVFLIKLRLAFTRRIRSSRLWTWFCREVVLQFGYDLSPSEKELFRRTSHRVTRLDDMFDGPRYFASGLSALRRIRRVVRESGMGEPQSILDFPSGYGRLCRFWNQVWSKAKVTVCDIHPEAVGFCQEAFGANPQLSSEQFDQLHFDSKHDLIFCGSLLSHLDENRIRDLLKCFQRALNPGGILIFTTHGEEVAQRYRQAQGDIGLGDLGARAELQQAEEYFKGGYSYYDPSRCGYGNTLTSPQWIKEKASEIGDWELLYFEYAGWLNYQDIFAYRMPDKK